MKHPDEPVKPVMPPERADLLERYVSLLATRGADLGVIAEGDRSSVRQRHVLDSLRATEALLPADHDVLDLGSGGGLPGIPVAIARPDLRVGLVESRRRRVAWLELVVAELALENAVVIPCRVEELDESVDVCLSRALAPPGRAWELAAPLLRPGGRLVYFAGTGEPRETLLRLARRVEFLEAPVLETSGPLAIISDQ